MKTESPIKFAPSSRLLLAVAILATPAACLAAYNPAYTTLALAVIAGLIFLVVVDLTASRHLLASLRVQAPPVVRLSVGRESQMRLNIILGKQPLRRLRLGLRFPSAIQTDQAEKRVLTPTGAEAISVDWSLRASKQGRYTLGHCYLETVSRLIWHLGGFWNIRASTSIDMEIRVYPDLWSERQGLGALFMNKGIGVHRQRQVGKGREFDQLREYQPGDSYEDIHWKATAKRQQPITRVHQVERTQQLYVVIDASRLSARLADQTVGDADTPSDAVSPATVLDRFITAALLLGMAAQRQGDLFGLLVFSDHVRVFMQARSGTAHFGACRDALYTLTPKRVSPDFNELFTFMGARIRRRSLMLFLTSLDDPVLAESFTRNIDIIGRRHLVLVTMLKPLLAQPLFSSPTIQSTQDLHRHLGGHFLWQTLKETAKVLNRRGVNLTFTASADLCPSLVSRYLDVKQRQVL